MQDVAWIVLSTLASSPTPAGASTWTAGIGAILDPMPRAATSKALAVAAQLHYLDKNIAHISNHNSALIKSLHTYIKLTHCLHWVHSAVFFSRPSYWAFMPNTKKEDNSIFAPTILIFYQVQCQINSALTR